VVHQSRVCKGALAAKGEAFLIIEVNFMPIYSCCSMCLSLVLSISIL